MSDDPEYYKLALGITRTIPSAETLRQVWMTQGSQHCQCNTIWTNLGWSDDDIINYYHAHGECKQFHNEIKTDMDVYRRFALD